jgi:hypothetical protein
MLSCEAPVLCVLVVSSPAVFDGADIYVSSREGAFATRHVPARTRSHQYTQRARGRISELSPVLYYCLGNARARDGVPGTRGSPDEPEYACLSNGAVSDGGLSDGIVIKSVIHSEQIDGI